ncbi:Rhodanese domain-containing protein/FSH1 domain-containing protein [Cephalotus follicularis]|uniref:Rhodanese domain-containing protein/FSH1 domain-containing protein n=1 Tax=Cephalotus follicularis TaxID=3775 RepID=A0A1Q3CZT6_CEPFO|nr:Rhodanese domain-containing protein/FSH1 domain-containing protein [Cephalotus follicularis]
MSVVDTPNKKHREEGEEEKQSYLFGVLLYYSYGVIPNLNSLLAFYHSNCNSLNLLGRVRLAPHGVNVTVVGGSLSSLDSHVAALKSFANSLFQGTDFKLAPCHRPLNDTVAHQCGFSSLSIRIVKELVTMSSHPLFKAPQISDAGAHLSALHFHSLLQHAGQTECSSDDTKSVLLDARNLYETRIGKFNTPYVKTLDPEIRQYSDLPSWIDSNSEQLRGKQVLMYCTGGIRCEMASAYIKAKGAGFENVFQLYGGIQRYLEQFPDGGFFKGKNFVFDHRISVGSSNANIVGTCLLCDSSFDDYSSRCRCTYCRMLVLVCDSCRIEGDLYVCELCQKYGKAVGLSSCSEESNPQNIAPEIEFETVSSDPTHSPELFCRHGTKAPRKLRILCLHGFRQNASSFKGRTASLAKKLRRIAEFVFIDAPHDLPFVYLPCVSESTGDFESSVLQYSPPPSKNCKKKFAWLVSPGSDSKSEADWTRADDPFDPLQYQQQTDGFGASLAYLKTVFSQKGPFDGILYKF